MSAVTVLPAVADDVAADVPEHEYRRLLQWPAGRPMPERLQALAAQARRWYATHGRPFVATRRVGACAINGVTVRLETGGVLTGAALAADLHAAAAHAVVVVVASAGHEVSVESARLWSDGRPDEAYFLDRLAATIAEGLLVRAASAVGRKLAARREQLLPHRSPGCGQWGLAEQHCLMELLGGACGPVTLLASGALSPQHSVLAAFGVTREAGATADAGPACRRCDLDGCRFRRARFRRTDLQPPGAP